MVTQVEFNTRKENIFYGMANTLTLYQNASKGMKITKGLMESAWRETSSKEQKAVLFIILFSVGDITARDHNIFGGNKVDSGGNSERLVFRNDIIPFLVEKVKPLNKAYRLQLMNLITEYTVMDNILANRVQTTKKTKKVAFVIDMIGVFGVSDVATYASRIILKGTFMQRLALSKFLTRPRESVRSKSEEMLAETKAIMKQRVALLKLVSEKAKLPFESKGNYTDFTGYYEWRKKYNGNFESVLFSSKRVLDLDKEEFFELLEKAPSDARFRIKNKVYYSMDKEGKLKWPLQRDYYEAWEQFKNNKQSEQRELENQLAQTRGVKSASEVEEIEEKIAKVKVEARVNVGAVNFAGMFKEIVNGTVDRVKVQPFMDKINLPYNTLVFIDDSGSMQSRRVDFGFSARQFAAFMATICLMKNPDAEARGLVGLFSRNCRMFSGITEQDKRPNSLMTSQIVKQVRQPLINPDNHFIENLNSFSRFLDANSTYQGTNVSSIADTISSISSGDADKIEELQQYPIWTLISDGNFNNYMNGAASINDMLRRCQNKLGFKPYLILIDVAYNSSQPITTFTGIDNVIMVPPNPASIEMILTNFQDMDIFDAYTPLQSMYRSNRYEQIKQFAETHF